MSFHYLKSSKKTYKNILADLNSTINNYEELLTKCIAEYGCFHEEIDFFFTSNKHNIDTIIELSKNTKEQINLCNTKLQSLCDHQFINDSIDINPDQSKNIRYCEICELIISK